MSCLYVGLLVYHSVISRCFVFIPVLMNYFIISGYYYCSSIILQFTMISAVLHLYRRDGQMDHKPPVARFYYILSCINCSFLLSSHTLLATTLRYVSNYLYPSLSSLGKSQLLIFVFIICYPFRSSTLGITCSRITHARACFCLKDYSDQCNTQTQRLL